MTSKRSTQKPVARLAALILGASLALPLPAPAADWGVHRNEREAIMVTTDEDGNARETTVWFVFVDSVLFIRAVRAARWGSNLERDPLVAIRFEGAEFDARASRVRQEPLMEAIADAVAVKYPEGEGWGRFLRAMLGGLKVYRLDPVASGP